MSLMIISKKGDISLNKKTERLPVTKIEEEHMKGESFQLFQLICIQFVALTRFFTQIV